MRRKIVVTVCLVFYSSILMLSAFFVGRISTNKDDGKVVAVSETAVEEEYYTVKENNGKLSVYKEDKLLMSLDTNVDILPSVVRAQLKNGIDFKPSELPGILEAFAE